ncbi:hypothetical protein B0H13DRAFT_2422636 [Mycena leptocephala]|nr:hypothetical protein B0H13DRAFT_2422636 [Mycena leptocephala]
MHFNRSIIAIAVAAVTIVQASLVPSADSHRHANAKSIQPPDVNSCSTSVHSSSTGRRRARHVAPVSKSVCLATTAFNTMSGPLSKPAVAGSTSMTVVIGRKSNGHPWPRATTPAIRDCGHEQPTLMDMDVQTGICSSWANSTIHGQKSTFLCLSAKWLAWRSNGVFGSQPKIVIRGFVGISSQRGHFLICHC